jgi:hypothetical protein
MFVLWSLYRTVGFSVNSARFCAKSLSESSLTRLLKYPLAKPCNNVPATLFGSQPVIHNGHSPGPLSPKRRPREAPDSDNPDLSAFQAAEGKLLQFHGWNDSAIPAASSIAYYNSVAAKMGGSEKIKAFYRLFLAPGMDHCGGGAGPNAIGGVFGAPPPKRDSTHGTLPRGFGVSRLIDLPARWTAQRNLLGIAEPD